MNNDSWRRNCAHNSNDASGSQSNSQTLTEQLRQLAAFLYAALVVLYLLERLLIEIQNLLGIL